MSAYTDYYVKVLRASEDTIKVQAESAADAQVIASMDTGVIKILEVKHWMEVEEEEKV